MTRSQPASSSNAQLIGLLCVLLVGCAWANPDDKQAPPSKEGTKTAPGCAGVTQSGTCEDGFAVYCDIEANMVQRTNCRTLDKSCIVDAARGAMCGGGLSCESGLSSLGMCDGDTARWCVKTVNETMQWDCAAAGMTCEEDKCASGAYCCSTAPQSGECPALGFAGECKGNVARWCAGDQLIESVCTGVETCQVDKCISGAYCCGPSECELIGSRGVCTPEGKMRWCGNGTIYESACTSPGDSCQIDKCGSGAWCCPT